MTARKLPESDEALADLLREAAHDPSAPPGVLQRAVALRSPAREMARKAVAAVRRLIAEPVFDAAGGIGAAAGVRGTGPAPRQLLFRAEACDVDVRVSAQGSAWIVAGQVFGAEAAREVVLTGSEGSRTTQLGPTDEFVFDGVATGVYALTVKSAQLDIVIPSVDVGAPLRGQ